MEANQQETIGSPQNKQCKHCKMEIPKDAKVCPYCRKKQGGKGKWIIIGVVVVLILLAAAGGDSEKAVSLDTNKAASSESTETEMVSAAVSDSVPVEEAEPEPAQSPEPTHYESGMYLVGKDIPAGEYAVFAERSLGYMEVASDSSRNFESILCNANFSYNTIVTLEEGRYFSMTGAYAVPIAEAQIDTTGSGMFKVGVNIPAGEYKIVVDEDAAMGLGYLEVASDSSHDFASIRTNDNIESSAYISVSEGEYLTLNECHIEP